MLTRNKNNDNNVFSRSWITAGITKRLFYHTVLRTLERKWEVLAFYRRKTTKQFSLDNSDNKDGRTIKWTRGHWRQKKVFAVDRTDKNLNGIFFQAGNVHATSVKFRIYPSMYGCQNSLILYHTYYRTDKNLSHNHLSIHCYLFISE